MISEELEEAIAAKLGNPTFDPHGDPIPDRKLAVVEVRAKAYMRSSRGSGTFVRVSDSDPEMLRFLAERRIAPGG